MKFLLSMLYFILCDISPIKVKKQYFLVTLFISLSMLGRLAIGMQFKTPKLILKSKKLSRNFIVLPSYISKIAFIFNCSESFFALSIACLDISIPWLSISNSLKNRVCLPIPQPKSSARIFKVEILELFLGGGAVVVDL